MSRLIALLLLVFAPSCAGLPYVHATFSGAGDVRLSGDTLAVVGGVSGELGLRANGETVVAYPPFKVGFGEWYLKSTFRGYERTAPLSEPMPSWAQDLYTPADLEALEALGLHLTFESSPQ